MHKGPQKEPWGDSPVPLATKKLAGDATSLDDDAARWPGKEQGALQDNVAHKDKSGGIATEAFQPGLGFPLNAPKAHTPCAPPKGPTGAKARFVAAHAPTARGGAPPNTHAHTGRRGHRPSQATPPFRLQVGGVPGVSHRAHARSRARPCHFVFSGGKGLGTLSCSAARR